MTTSRELEYGECGRMCNPVDGHGWTGACRIYQTWKKGLGRASRLPVDDERTEFEQLHAKGPDKRKAAEFERETDDDGPLRVEHGERPTLGEARACVDPGHVHDAPTEADMIIKADRELTAGEYSALDRQVAGSHYMNASGIQPWHVIDAYQLDFYRGNALKYLLRAGRKGSALEDLRKCRHYLDRIIELEQEKGNE